MGAHHAEKFTEQLVLNPPFGTFWRERPSDWDEDKTERIYKQYSILKKECIVEFRARMLPGCCGVLVVYYLRPQRAKNQVKIFKQTLATIIKVAAQTKYGAVMLTQTAGSLGYQALFDYPNMSSIPDFINGKTRNYVGVFVIPTGYVPPILKPKFDGE